MLKTIKTVVSLFALVGILSACSSSGKKGSSVEAESAPVSTVETTTTDDSSSDAARLAGVATVFYFEFDQSTLNSEARAALTIHAEVLNRSPRSIRLEGHADERGSREYNMALGERRANAVRDFLILQGVSSQLIETISYGEERPAQSGSNESTWSANRRVELK